MAPLDSVVRSLTENVLSLFYEEADVARWITFAGTFTVPDPTSGLSDRHFRFDAPGVLPESLPAVFFQTASSTPEPSFSVRLNSTPHLVATTLASGDPHSWHKLGTAGSLMPQGNELVFAVEQGTVTFSDVFVLYTSNQLTVRKRRQIVATQ
jgi:hypothetical protein